MFVRQLIDRDTSTYTYLIADEKTSEAAIIDPVKEQLARDVQLITELGFKLKYILETHVHADHITSSGKLREIFSAEVAIHEDSGAKCADKFLKDNDILKLGEIEIKAMHTPGHTNADMTYVAAGYAFTGDALLIRDCGRTDFQLGDSATLYNSIKNRIFSLEDNTVIYPGHDYRGLTASTVKEEKQYNNRLGNGKEQAEFIEIMNNLKLSLPQRIKESVPGNIHCGI